MNPFIITNKGQRIHTVWSVTAQIVGKPVVSTSSGYRSVASFQDLPVSVSYPAEPWCSWVDGSKSRTKQRICPVNKNTVTIATVSERVVKRDGGFYYLPHSRIAEKSPSRPGYRLLKQKTMPSVASMIPREALMMKIVNIMRCCHLEAMQARVDWTTRRIAQIEWAALKYISASLDRFLDNRWSFMNKASDE